MRKFLVVLALAMTASCCRIPEFNVLPYPQSVTLEKGSFRVDGVPVICDLDMDEASRDVAENFSRAINASGRRQNGFYVSENASNGGEPAISFVKDASLDFEAYSLDVNEGGVMVRAASKPGFFYAVQTLKQMLPESVYASSCDSALSRKSDAGCKLCLPYAKINDKPAFGYRGMMLDCARHFFSVDEVKRYIDIMSVYKLNRLHWHLTDDQGWRFESVKYPELTVKGAYRDSTIIRRGPEYEHSRYGGFYTREEMKSIVEYAAERCITVIPEIDMPGHMQAALATYPELGCNDGPYGVRPKWGISHQVLCPGKPKTMQFLKDILTELTEVFPSEYIHIGGDECPKEEWKESPECQALIRKLGLKDDEKYTAEQKLQSWLTAQLCDHLAALGRKAIGWDEVLEGTQVKNVTVMSWRGTQGGVEAARRDLDVIFTPSTYCYFDYSQSPDLKSEPYGITTEPRRALPLYRTYSFDPYDRFPGGKFDHILGVQANLWTEYIATPEHLEYMLLPRLGVLSEIQWSNPASRSFNRVLHSIEAKHFGIYDAMGYNCRRKLTM